MEKVTLRDASNALNAETPGLSAIPVAGVSIDSRSVSAGDLFFAIRGERFDGHDFVEEAFENGAVGAVVSRGAGTAGSPGQGGALIKVCDTLQALQDLASWYRSRFDLTVVAVTGTNGKTTTKDMTAAVLSTAMPTASTEGNLNNHIGVPLTLLELGSEHRAAVVEMGMNHPGEIRRLAAIAKPSVGVITNVAEAHLESMETLDAVAEAKGELLEALPAGGTAVLNADDARVMAQAKRTEAGVRTFGLGPGAGLRATRVAELAADGGRTGVEFEIEGDGTVELPVPGRHNVSNALAALVVGDVLGAERAAAIAALASFRSSPMRMRMATAGPWTILNDAYNSNPGSLAVALETLAAVAGGRAGSGSGQARPKADVRTVAALGDMLELGARSEEAHHRAGKRAAELGVDRLFLFGHEVAALRDGAIAGGMPPENVKVYEDKIALVRGLLELPEGDAVLLVKGSRGMRMEEVVELLVKEAPAS